MKADADPERDRIVSEKVMVKYINHKGDGAQGGSRNKARRRTDNSPATGPFVQYRKRERPAFRQVTHPTQPIVRAVPEH